MKVLGDPNEEVALAAGHALFSIGPQALPGICRELRNADLNVRRIALYAISNFGPLAKSAVVEIERAVAETRDPVFQNAARKTLNLIINPGDEEHESQPQPIAPGCLRSLLIGTCVIALGWYGVHLFRQHAANEIAIQHANQTAKRNLRDATSILNLWLSDIKLDLLPQERPHDAEQLLKHLVESNADPKFKQQAIELQDLMQEYRYFFRVANQMSFLAPSLNELVASLSNRNSASSAMQSQDSPHQRLTPSFLVLTMPSRLSDNESDSISPSLDAQLINALGNRCATSVDDLGTLIVLQWHQERRGTRELDIGSETIQQPLYIHRCHLMAILAQSRHVVMSKRFEVVDEKRTTLTINSSLNIRPDEFASGLSQLRTLVMRELIQLTGIQRQEQFLSP